MNFLNRCYNSYSEWRKTNKQYKYIIVGAGTGGCITAYTLASIMKNYNLKGRVLLIDSGNEYNHSNGPHPKMWNWFDNWSKFAVTHETIGIGFLPAPGSSHHGVGGCGAHDTRITFRPRPDQIKRYCEAMKWTPEQFLKYMNTVIAMMPITTADCNEPFYTNVVNTIPPSMAPKFVDIAMYSDETRWTSAYLLDKRVRPNNLDVLTHWPVDKLLFDENKRVVGVVNADTAAVIKVGPSSEVLLTTGSLGTPAILQRSGIGPKTVLDALGIKPIVYHDEIGHGVDHIEVAVSYEYAVKNGDVPRGGPMAWPVVLHPTEDTLAHFGISPPPYGGNEVMGTPNCMHPDPNAGFHAHIQTTNPKTPIHLLHSNPHHDIAVLKKGVVGMINAFETMKAKGLVGNRVQPTDADLLNDGTLDLFVRNHIGTAYHWMSTCKAGHETSRPVDENFKVRGVSGLRVGSGAVLPEIPEFNPHFTISVFSVALAYITAGITPEYYYNNAEVDVHPLRRHPDVTYIASEYRNQKKD